MERKGAATAVGEHGPAGCVFVLGALHREVAATTATVVALGFADAGSCLAPLDEQLGAAAPAGERLRRLLMQARRRLPAAPWVFGAPGLAATLPLWRQVLADVGSADEPHAILVTCEAASACAQMTRADRRTPAVAAALWDRSTRQALHAVVGLPTLVVTAQGHDDDVAGFLGVLNPPTRDGRPPRRRQPVSVGGAGTGSATGDLPTRELEAVVAAHKGAHPRFTAPVLPEEDPAVGLLIDADRCFERQRTRLETCLTTAVSAVEGLQPAPRPAPPPFEPAYGLDATEDGPGYQRWLARDGARCRVLEPSPAGGVELPAISIVVVVRRPETLLLERCLTSITAQSFGAWQLCLGSATGTQGQDEAAKRADRLVETMVEAGARVCVAPPQLGAVAAANAAAALAEAPFLAFLDQHDELDPSALADVVTAMSADDEIDLLYTDEDEIDRQGGRRRPRLKPDWSPDLLLSMSYVGSLLVVRRRLFEKVGGLRPELEGSEHFDLALRVTEQARHVAHVPRIAYHRRAGERRPPPGVDRVPGDELALRSAVERRREDATVEEGMFPGSYRVRRRIRTAPLVSIVVPFRDGASLLRRCVDSISETAGYDRWQLLLVDNLSWEPETVALIRQLSKDPRCRVVSYPQTFNWSAVNNFGAREADGDLLLFLNSDVEGRSPGWLAAMVEHAQRPEVGAVGARLLYPNGSLQHAGVAMGLGGGVSWHPFVGCPGEGAGYLGQARVIRNCSAVTGACLLVRRDSLDAVGGLDESLAVCFNDIDLCLRLRAQGHLVVYTPFAELVHHESSTRGRASPTARHEIEVMFDRWAPVIERDPYLNPNLHRLRAELALPG